MKNSDEKMTVTNTVHPESTKRGGHTNARQSMQGRLSTRSAPLSHDRRFKYVSQGQRIEAPKNPSHPTDDQAFQFQDMELGDKEGPAASYTALTRLPACSVLTWKKESGETLNGMPFTTWVRKVLPKSLFSTGKAFSLPNVAASET